MRQIQLSEQVPKMKITLEEKKCITKIENVKINYVRKQQQLFYQKKWF